MNYNKWSNYSTSLVNQYLTDGYATAETFGYLIRNKITDEDVAELADLIEDTLMRDLPVTDGLYYDLLVGCIKECNFIEIAKEYLFPYTEPENTRQAREWLSLGLKVRADVIVRNHCEISKFEDYGVYTPDGTRYEIEDIILFRLDHGDESTSTEKLSS